MKKTWSIRVLCLLTMIALALPPIAASADIVTSNGQMIDVFSAADEASKTSYLMAVTQQEAGSATNGFYYVPSTSYYFRASDLTIVGPTPTPTPSSTPTPSPVPGEATPSPTPETITGEKDPTYEGKILNYTVPAGGLWLYNSVGGSAVESISAGSQIKLTSVKDESGWYSVYYKSKTFYVPESILYLTTDAIKNTASVVLKSGTISLYTKATAGTSSTPPDLTLNRSSNTLEGGSRVPAKYFNTYWYTYQLGSSTYYIYAGDVEGGLNSSASVGSNEDTTFMREFKVPAGATLYRVMDMTSTNSYTLVNADTLYGTSVNSEWNRVMYNNEIFYLNNASITSSTQVAVAGTTAGATYLVTVGMNGAYLYKTRTRNLANPEVGNVGKLPAGQSVMASPVDTTWYSYSSGTNLYYIHSADIGTTTSTSSMSSIKVFLKSGTALYDKTTATNPTTITLTSSSVTLSDGSIGDYYVVQSVNDTWYSITYDGKLYYIKKSDSKAPTTTKVITVSNAKLYAYVEDPTQNATYAMPYTGSLPIKEVFTDARRAQFCKPPDGEKWYYVVTESGVDYLIATASGTAGVVTDVDYSNPIATTTAGKEYYVTIGLTAATLFKDAACTQAATITIKAGEVVLATKYTDSLYIVSSSGTKYYLPIRYISSIRGGDDAAAVNPTPTDSIADITKGESSPDFSGNVFSFKIPVSGLWLYYKMDNNARSLSLNYGTSIQLTEVASDPNWYTTWYGGSQYYVPKTSLSVTDADIAVNNTYSITLNANVTLYTAASFSAIGVPAATNKATGITLNAGARVNVRVASKLTGGVTIYAYTHMDGKTYYFTSLNVVADSALSATVDSNANTSFITQFSFKPTGGVDTIRLYTGPSTSSSSTDVSFATKEMTLFGVKYDNSWDKIIYNNATWYMLRAEYIAVTSLTPEQISISSDSVTSTTFTVVIGSSEALLYTRPDATKNTYFSGFALSPGETILASKVSSTWYSCAKNGTTYYFQAVKIANNNSTSAVSSYIISILATDNVSLYNTISETGLSTLSLPDGSYTMRKINSTWSSVLYNGKTYYVKNNDLPAEAVFQSIPIASTTVGKTYKITIGKDGADVFSSGKLSPPRVASLEGGYQTMGTKLYISDSSAPNGLVYSISHGGQIRYISAAAVTGVMEGDEVEEAKKAAEDADKAGDTSPIAIGTTTLNTFAIGSIVYAEQSTTSTKFAIPSTMILSATKVNANWYSISYAGKTYYVPVADLEKGTGTNTTTTTKQLTLSVGESYTLTFTGRTPYYAMPDRTEPTYGTVEVGEVYSVKRVSDEWYEVVINTRVFYMLATDVLLPVITITTPVDPSTTTTTHDGTGYITQYLTVSVASGSLNLRKTASTSSVVLDRIPNGAQMLNNSYIVDSAKKVWYSVTYGGRTGYVLGDYVKPVGTGGTSGGGTSTNPALDIGKSFLVNTASVNIRSGAGMKYSILGRLDKNVAVTPIDYATGDDNLIWYKFQYTTSLTAWIRSDYLAGSAISSTEQSGNVAIKQGDTNIRSGAGDSFTVVVKLPRDTIVSIVGKGTDNNNVLWYRIVINSISGYVRSDLVRPLTAAETSSLMASVISQYTELRYGSKGPEVKALQEKLINLGHMAAGTADGVYGPKTTEGVKAYQRAKSLAETGVATRELQALIYNTSTSTGTGTIQSLDWFATGYTLINANKNITIYDIPSGITWNARYINGANHADVIPASKADAAKLVANNVVGSYVRRSVVVTIAGTRYAGSMYALGHGTTNYCDYFNGVMCIHFTGSKTHGTGNVDADHQAAINGALNSGL